MTLSHNFPTIRKHVHTFTASLLQSSSFLLLVDVATIFLSQIFSAVLFNDYIYTLDSFRGGSGQVIAQLPQHLATIPQHFLSFLFSAFQLLIYFHKPVIFPDVVDFPSVFKFSAFNHFPAQPTPSRFNIPFQLFERTCFCFFKSHTTNRYTNQPTSRVQFLCACRWHRKPIASLFRFCIRTSKLLHTFIILDCIM